MPAMTERAAASRLLSTLKGHNKPCPDGAQAVDSLEHAIRAAQTQGLGTRRTGLIPQPATVAAALAFNAGCGRNVHAMARRFYIGSNGVGVRNLADRLAARAWIWEGGDEGSSAAACSSPPLPPTTSPPLSSPPPPPPASPRPRSFLGTVQGLWRNLWSTTPAPPTPDAHEATTCVELGDGVQVGDGIEPPHVCPVCSQPPLSDAEFWGAHSGTDLASCPTCLACRLPRIPTSWADLVVQINERYHHEELGAGEFDNGRIGVPRPHEHALWHGASDDVVKSIARLLRERQHKCPPWEKIVSLSSDADALISRPRHHPLQVECPGCHTSRNFDYLYGSFERIKLNTAGGRGGKYLKSPSIIDFNVRIVPQVVRALSSPEIDMPKLEWLCCNCEATEQFAEARTRNRAAELAASAALGLQGPPPQLQFDQEAAAATLNSYSVGLGVPLRVCASDIPSVPCKASRNLVLDGFTPAAGVLMLRRELADQLINGDAAQIAALMGAPSVRDLFSAEATAIGSDDATISLAGGDSTVTMALLLIVPSSLMDRLMLLPPRTGRANALLEAMRAPSSDCEAVAVATLDGNLPSAEAVFAERAEFFRGKRGSHDDCLENGKCETGRPGNLESWAALGHNPDIIRYARMAGLAGGATHTDHMLIVANQSGEAGHCLFIYPSGPNGRAAPFLPPQAQLKDGKRTGRSKAAHAAGAKKRRLEGGQPSSLRIDQLETSEETLDLLNQHRLCYGQPRHLEVPAGRPFLDATLSENRDLQLQNGPNAEHARAVALCGLKAMLFLAACGLAPGPTDDVDEWKQAREPPLLGDGVAETCRYTWYLCSLHAQLPAAVAALACIQGYYENAYGAFVHKDNNGYMESYSLRRTEERAAWALAEGLSVVPTQVPQLYVELHAEPNRTVWTGFFQRLLHCAPDVPVAERPTGWKPSRSAGEIFALQARGSVSYHGVAYRIWRKCATTGGWVVEEHTRGP